VLPARNTCIIGPTSFSPTLLGIGLISSTLCSVLTVCPVGLMAYSYRVGTGHRDSYVWARVSDEWRAWAGKAPTSHGWPRLACAYNLWDKDEVNHAIAAHRRWSSICLVKNTGLCAQRPPIHFGYYYVLAVANREE
jgi:hypothetical protein